MSWTRFIIGSDVHGDMQDPAANRVFFNFCDDWKPKIRIMAGDLWDFRSIRKGASDDERRESMRADLKAGKDWFNRFKPNYFLLGNHDERLWQLAEKDNGAASDYAREGVEEINAMTAFHKCKVLPRHVRDGVLVLGHLKVLHGFHTGVNAARMHANAYQCCLFGHTHTIDEAPVPGLERRVARGIGCLCTLVMDFNKAQTNTLRHAHGFAYGLLNEKTGNYHVYQAEEIDGKWMLPSEFKAY